VLKSKVKRQNAKAQLKIKKYYTFDFLLARLQRLMRSICGQVILTFDFCI
jgi:hypothetical protein